MHARAEHPVGRPTRRGFTLTELIVAIGAVLLVSYGVGQIFSSVGQLTSYGRASAEIDAMARQIEQRLREDFEGFARMDPEETFMAIRMREIGDLARDADFDDPGERPVFVTPEDLEADLREGLDPYEIVNLGTPDRIDSKAVTRRLDEIVFFARAPEGRPFVSQQLDPSRTGGAVTASVARIYWGHALRPRFDESFDPDNSVSGYPDRQWTPDGDFAMPANPTELYSPGDPDGQPFIPRGRNRFAGEWMLARQPMLMFGGLAAGHPNNGSDPIGPFPIGVNREFAPFINDVETLRRYTVRGASDALQLNPLGGDPIFDDSGWPDPRLITWGRVDICAQDERDVRRWFEGQSWYDSTINPPMPVPSPASPFSTGFDSTIDFLVGDSGWLDEPNGPLWMRSVMREPGVGSPEAVLTVNQRGLRSAIAGTFTRLLADDLLSRPNRMPQNTDRVQSEDNSMDFHAILSSRCSNFEIAWSDGRRAAVDINYDQDPDNTEEIKAGDLIWFDISPAMPPASASNPLPNFDRRNTFEEWRQFEINAGDPLTTGSFEYTAQRPRSEVPGGIFVTQNDIDTADVWADQILLTHAQNNAPFGIPPGAYSTAITGGERNAGNPSGIDREPNELLNIWGFRLPTADGGYGAAWVKPAFIRVRITLHDDQFRIAGGKSYEFIFSLRPESSL